MKSKKLLSLLIAGLMVTGCDVEALPTDYEETYGSIKMEELYNTIRNGQGEAAIYNDFIEAIAEKEIKDNNRVKELYSRIDKKIEDMIEDQYTDYDYSLYGEVGFETVNYDKLNAYHRSQGYTIENGANGKDAWKAEDALTGGAKNTYIEKVLKPEVLSSMLNEQFIKEKKSNSLYKTKQLREIEYLYIDFDDENEDKSLEFAYSISDRLTNNANEKFTTDLEVIANEWKTEKKRVIEENAKKAGDPVKDEDGKYYTEFTSCSNSSVLECANEKMHAVDETDYYNEPKVYAKADSPVIQSITDVLYNSTLKDNLEDKAIKVEEKVKDENGNDVTNTYYYLKQITNVESGNDSIVNVDSTTGNYYFVRFNIVDNTGADYSNFSAHYEGQDKVYTIAEALATESSNYSNCIIYYLDKYSFTIHDDKFFEYIFDTYGYPEEE